jgi:hypothetical protein
MNNNLQPIAGQAQATVDVMAAPLQITAAEGLRLAELIRTRRLPSDKAGRLPVSVIESLLRELRCES